MKKIDKSVPCYRCERRCVTSDYNCHSDCPDYKEYADAIAERRDTIRKKRAEESLVNETRFKSMERLGFKQTQSAKKG